MKHALKGFVLLLVALAIVRLAVMVVAPVFDPSEGRYAAICANMAESGDFLVPRFIHNRVFQSFDGKPDDGERDEQQNKAFQSVFHAT